MPSVDKKTDPWQMIQTFVLVATAAGLFVTVGRKDHFVEMNGVHIGELRDITQDLVKSQVLSEANDSTHAFFLEELKNRIQRLEDRGD